MRVDEENDTPTALHIKFDRIDEVQTINRVSAVYDVSVEEQRTRRQFPVQMSFACTTHKCQGLTLDNALVSTRSVFCAGQFNFIFNLPVMQFCKIQLSLILNFYLILIYLLYFL